MTSWMRDDPSKEDHSEDFLLGKEITDKYFEQQGSMGQINAVEYDCTPMSIFSSQADHQVDIAKKVQEDPLIALKKQELDTRKKVLDNPIRMKQIQKYLEANKKSKKDKKKKKKKHKKHRSSSSSSSDSESDLDKLLLKKLENFQPKAGPGSDPPEADSDYEEKTASPKRRRHRSRSRDRDHPNHKRPSSPEDARVRRKRSPSPRNDKHRRRRSPSPRNDQHRRRRSPSPRNDQHRRRRSPSPRSDRHSKRRRSPSPRERRSRSPRDGKSRRSRRSPSPRDDKPRRKRSPDSPASTSRSKGDRFRQPDLPSKKKPLDEAEREKRLQEMMSNADWRETQRTKNVAHYKEMDEKEERRQRERHDPSFIRRQLDHAASSGSVEKRIQANRHNIQRGGQSMDKNFARR